MSYRRPYLFLSNTPLTGQAGSVNTFGTPDAALFRSVDRPLVVAGRLPDARAPLSVVINEFAAERLHLHVGSPLHLYAPAASVYRSGQLPNLRRSPAGPSYVVRVAGIIRLPSDVNAIIPVAARQDVSYEGQLNVFVTPAFVHLLATDLGIPVQQLPVMNVFAVRLRHGAADWPAFAAAASRLGAGRVPLHLPPGDDFGLAVAAGSAQRGIHLEVVALLLFGALAALVTLFLAGQSISRLVRHEGDDYATLRSLGATRAQLAGIALLRAALVGAGGAALAFTVAVLGSPLMPLGLARQAEVHPGFEINVAILVPGCLALSLLVVARSAIPAWRTSRPTAASAVDDSPGTRPSRLAGILARASAPAAAVVGVRFGLESGRGRTAVPVTSAMVTGAAAVATLAAAMTFGTSLAHLVNTPRQQGWNWDVLVGNPNDVNDREVTTGRLLGHDRLIGSFSASADLGAVTIEGLSVPTVLAIDPLKGSVYPPLLEGRAPRAPDEIVLGTRTLQQVHRRVGQSVRVSTPGGANTMRVVGRMVVPSVGDVLTNSLGEGGWVSGSLVHRQWTSPANPSGHPPSGTDVFNIFAVRYAPGASPAAAFASLQRQFGRTVLRQLPAEDAVNLQSVDSLPFVLAGLVVLLGVATVGNTVIVSVRRRRRDLAILKTIGFVRRQVTAAVAWQATSFAVVALVIGMPLGVAGGRLAWSLVAAGIDSASPALVPALAVAFVVPAALAVANLVAAWPGWVAARVAPAVVMRAE